MFPLKVWQSCSSDPFSLQPKQLQPDYVSSHNNLSKSLNELQQKVTAKDAEIQKLTQDLKEKDEQS